MASGAMTLMEAHREGFARVVTHTQRFLAYVRDLPPAEYERPVPGLTWTVAELVVHVRSVYERYTVDRRRSERPEDISAQNAQDIARLGLDVDAATTSIEQQLTTLTGIVDHVAPERTFPFHAGQQITLAGGWGNLLGELLAHGDDLARATGRPFGIPDQDLEILWRFTLPVFAGWLLPDARQITESWQLQLPIGDLRVVLDHGSLHVEDDVTRPADHTISVDDVQEFTLAFPYRRRPITDPAAALLASRFTNV